MNLKSEAADHPTFTEYAWNGFEVLHVLSLLLSPTPFFFAQSKILFAALGAWIVAPKNDKLRQAAIIRAMRQELVRIEASGTAKAGSVNLVMADVTERLRKPGIEAFYEHVYYPIGGLKTLSGPRSIPNFFRFYQENTRIVKTALEVIEIYHYHAQHLSSKDEYRSASLNAAARLVKEFGGVAKRHGGDAIDNIKKQWRASRPSISLAYAASSMHFQKGIKYSDLLHVMQSGGRALQAPADVLPKLIGRARFVEETILANTYANEGEGIDLNGLGIEATQMKPPVFSESDRAEIARAFVRYPKVG